MIVSNNTAVGDGLEMGSGGVQYKVTDPRLPSSSQTRKRCRFKNTVIVLVAVFSLIVVILITWIVTKSVYQVKGSKDVNKDIVSASYILSKLDTSVDPCDNFYQFACGGWVKDQWKEDIYILQDETDQYEEKIRTYLQDPVKDDDLVSYKNAKLIYQKCLSKDRESDRTDIENWMEKLFSLTTSEKVMEFAADLGVFVFYEVQEQISPLQTALLPRHLAGLTEPRIDALIKEQPKDLGQKDNIVNFLQTMQSLLSQPLEPTAIETFIKGTTFVNLRRHFEIFGLTPSDKILSDPQLVAKTQQFVTDNLSDDSQNILNFVKSYTGILIQQRYGRLVDKNTDESFCYYSFASTYFGFAVGSLMLGRENTNYTETLATVQDMVSTITQEYKEIITESYLLSEKGKSSAIKKLDNLKILIGAAPWIKNDTRLRKIHYPGELQEGTSLVTMYKLVNTYFQKRYIESALHATITDLWEVTMGPQIALNAAYFQHENAISVPVGAFIPPYFDQNWPLSMKYGALGAIIGHEITHAFDRHGMRYDSDGIEGDLWDSGDAESVRNEQTCLISQYNNFGHYEFKINGTITLNENFADNGGLKVAYQAYKSAVGNGKSFQIPGLDFTSDQIFFMSFAQMRCYKYNEETVQFSYNSIYSPPDFRAIGPVMNSLQFSKAFSCPSHSKMNSVSKCRTL